MWRLDYGQLQLSEKTLPEACCLFFFILHYSLLFSAQNIDEGKAQLRGGDTHAQYGAHITFTPTSTDVLNARLTTSVEGTLVSCHVQLVGRNLS